MINISAASMHGRVAKIAADRRVHKAFQWMHLHERQIMQWQTELVSVPAPPFAEGQRAEWVRSHFADLGLEDTRLDAIGNVFGVRRATRPSTQLVLISAHIDTVFPAETVIKPVVKDTRLEAPGACDNGAGVVCLLALAAAMRYAEIDPPCDMLFAGNVGEEGEGNLRGMRFLYEQPEFAHRIAAHLVIDGAGHELAVMEALASRRFEVTIRGPGGHSWSDAGRPNPIVAMSRAIARLSEVELSTSPRTTMNVGTISGGTSTNVVPDAAAARFDFRSTSREQLARMEAALRSAVEDAVHATNPGVPTRRNQSALEYSISQIGLRPAGALASDAPLLLQLRAVDRHLNIRTTTRVASTDANIPLSIGVPALSIGAGGSGGGVHTLQEWYDSKDREIGLRRTLLLLLMACG